MAVLVLPVIGAPYQKDAPGSGMNQALLSAMGKPLYRETLVDMADRYVQVKLSSAQVLTLNTTPVLLVATPGSGKTIIPVAVYGSIDYNSTTYVTNSN